MANGPTNGNGVRGKFLSAAISIGVSLILAAMLGLVTLWNRVGTLESSLGVSEGARQIALRERVIALEGRVAALEGFRSEGRRFTWDDGKSLERRVEALEGRDRR